MKFDFDKNATYRVVKIDSSTEKETNYGDWGMEDVKLIVRGYTWNGLFFERKGSRYFFTVEKSCA